MCKKTYEVQKTPNNDTSYRSFVCSLLIFLALCTIIIVAGNFRNWTNKSNSSESWQEKSVGKEEVEQMPGYPEDKKNPSDKSRESTTTTTTTTSTTEHGTTTTTEHGTTATTEHVTTATIEHVTTATTAHGTTATTEHGTTTTTDNGATTTTGHGTTTTTEHTEIRNLHPHETRKTTPLATIIWPTRPIFKNDEFDNHTITRVINETTESYDSTLPAETFTSRSTERESLYNETAEAIKMTHNDSDYSTQATDYSTQATKVTKPLLLDTEDPYIRDIFKKVFGRGRSTSTTLINDYATPELETINKSTNPEFNNYYSSGSNEYHDGITNSKPYIINNAQTEKYDSNESTEYLTTSTDYSSDYSTEISTVDKIPTDVKLVDENRSENSFTEMSSENSLATKLGLINRTATNDTEFETNSNDSEFTTNYEIIDSKSVTKMDNSESDKFNSNRLNGELSSTSERESSTENEIVFVPGITEKLVQLEAQSNKIIQTSTEKTVAEETLETEIMKTALSQANKTEIVSSATLSIDRTTPFKYVDSKTSEALITTKFTKPMDGDITRATTEKEEISGERSRDSALFRKSAPVCHTSECKSVGSRMLSLMNGSIDACEDFYAFSCGGVHKDNADSDAWNVLLRQMMQISDTSSDHLVKFRSFYNSCLEFHYQIGHKERVDEVSNILKNLGFKSRESLESMELSEILSISLYLNSLQFMQIGFTYSVSTSRNVLQLRLPEESSVEIGLRSALWTNQRRCLAEQRQRIYEPDLNLTVVHESYSKCLQDNHELGALVREACVNQDIQQEYVEETIGHLKKMMQMYPSQAEIKEAILGNKLTVFKVNDLKKNYPSIEWSEIFKKLTNQHVPDDLLVNVYFKDYLKKWLKEFSNVKNQKHFLLNLLKTHLYYNLVLNRQSKDVEKYCLKTTASIFNDIASNLYVKSFKVDVIDQQKYRVLEIFKILKKALAESLSRNDHLLPAVYKLNKMNIKFSTAAETCDDHLLENKYKTLQGYKLYQKNLVTSLPFKMEHILDTTAYSFGNIVNSYDTKPVTFYGNCTNIYVPLGMVTKIPLSLPSQVTLGMIGFPLAKAIGKHFDPVGIQTQILQTSVTKAFDTLISNTNDLYTEFINKIHHFRVKPNFHLSLQDRISDNTALKLVTDSYKYLNITNVMPWLHETESTNSTEKVLFLSVAQGFCQEEDLLDFMLRFHESNNFPGPMRVNGIIQNSEYFSETFECPEGSEMNAPLKSQFPYMEIEEDYEDIHEDNYE